MNEPTITPVPPIPPPSAEALPGAPAPQDSLGSRVLKGATWIMIQSILAQLLALGSKIIVLRKLSKPDIATATFAMSACAFLAWLQPALGEVLVQRQKHFKQWAGVAFWITAAAAGLVLVAGAVLGPIFAYVNRANYPALEIGALVFITTISMAFTSLTVTFTAEQTIHFQFRRLAWIGTVASLVTALLTIAMAFLNCGSWTLVVPVTIANGLMLMMLYRRGRFRPTAVHHVQAKRAGTLLRLGLLLTGVGFFSTLCLQADNYFVGQFQPDNLTNYMVAYSMSFQFVQLASRSIRGTFLTAFTSMTGDDDRARKALLEAVKLVALISMPASILVIPSAHAAVSFVFSGKYNSAVPMFQIFLSGMGFVALSTIATSVWYARGWFRLLFFSGMITAAVFCVSVALTAAFFSVENVAMVVTAIYIVSSIIGIILAATPSSLAFKCRLVWESVLPFVLSCAGAVGGAQAVEWAKLDVHGLPGAALALIIGTLIYLGLAFVFLRGTLQTAITRLRHTSQKTA